LQKKIVTHKIYKLNVLASGALCKCKINIWFTSTVRALHTVHSRYYQVHLRSPYCASKHTPLPAMLRVQQHSPCTPRLLTPPYI
jgi:hypothetical protein